MDKSAEIFLACSLSLTSIIIGIVGLAVKSQCESVDLCWGCVKCTRKQKKKRIDSREDSDDSSDDDSVVV